MGKPLRVLIVEDHEQDALLVLRELTHVGFDLTWERVDTPEAMTAALTKSRFDLVLSDYSMPRFNAPSALALMKELKLDLPFIIVSGSVGEDVAVESLRAGAHDFMSKGRLARLGPAVTRELREAASRAEQVRMREQLLISERMASVGTLAAGIAHELNNPLTPLMASLGFIADDVAGLLDLSLEAEVGEPHGPTQAGSDGGADGATTAAANAFAGGAGVPLITRLRVRLGEIEGSLRDAREAAERVRNIVRDLKVFSRSDDEETGPVDVRRVTESALRIAWNEIRHRARLVKDYGDVPPVEANEGRLGQVILNLLVNAAQAIPEGHADQNEIRISTRVDELGRVVIAVSDTGSGISESVLSRIFEPFFTTKPIGVGTGLGLSICHRIIETLGGQIQVESQPGKGSVFRAALPAAQSEPRRRRVKTAVPAAARRGRILVIDDEPTIGLIVKRMLGAEHDVQVTTDARVALERIEAGERFDVMLCDLMMPQMTGMDLHDEILRIAPDQVERIVFITGGAFTTRAREFLDHVRNPRIEKPFDVGGLCAIVHRMM